MGRNSDAASTFSETSTVCSFDKETSPEPQVGQHNKTKRSMRQRVKRALRDVGNPPTYRYDLEHGIDTQRTVPVGPTGFNVLNQPSRM
ncbi:hypothetical protein Cob_v004993 [Colletotrichum orbiculare MAFF 240422]|uniref:Uncharacterized protein n=1 Tax=Colletotrichum orbiculare (strain 104-T / ATCC 96160 / CBS 514.97 / LARS 414 / MAFF 240422) TaxID=1213857 RepID=A0A484FVA2_COLOR|nr:hypothetical protein Cob_v004993 [Colletotrichum orbiculare MAFF 240422]